MAVGFMSLCALVPVFSDVMHDNVPDCLMQLLRGGILRSNASESLCQLFFQLIFLHGIQSSCSLSPKGQHLSLAFMNWIADELDCF
jgi:hypothetical protein